MTYDGSSHTATGSCTGVGNLVLSGLVLTGTTHTNVGIYNSDPWSFTDVTGNYNNASGAVNDVISKPTPTVTTWPTASAITSGQALSASTLSGGSASVAGSFAFTTPGTTPAVGTANQNVTFTPTDIANYSAVNGTVSVTVNKATPTVTTWPTASAITSGQALSSSTLSGGSSSVPGNFAFTTPGTTPPVGTASQNVVFTPSDTVNYNTVSGTVSVTVNKTAPTVTTWPTASAINYGQALSASTLSGGSASVAGSFAFTTPGTTPTVGTVNQNVTFTPTDIANYSAVSGTVSVTVNKATPTVTTWPTATAITYGQALSASTLSGGSASVAGSFAFTTPGTTPAVGTASQNVTFTPTDTTNYNSVNGTVSVTVNKATPTVTTWPTASAITSGQALSASTLSGGVASVAGNFAFTAPTTTPAVGTASQSVTFTPSDTTNYTTVSGTVSVTVNKTAPTVTSWPTASAINYGQALSSSILSGGSASVAGSFAFTTPSTVPNAGTANQNVTFTPSDTANYSAVSGTVSVTVNKVTPTLSFANSPVTYDGSSHSAAVTGSVAGSVTNITYNGSSSTPTTAGTYAVTADFTPTDSNYNSLTGASAGNFVISKATPSLTVTNSPLPYNGSARVAIVSGTVPGNVTNINYGGVGTQPVSAGSYAVTADFVPNDTTNYTSLSNASAGSFVITKAVPTLTVTNSPVTFDGNPHAATVTGSVPGVVGTILTGGAATQSAIGVYAVTANFTPNDTTNYTTLVNASAGNFAIVAPATVSITIQTVPTGLSVSVDGGAAQTAPYTFAATAGSSHTVATTSPQTSGGTRNVFSSWSDGKAVSHSITAPLNGSATYTASFTTEYLLTTAVSPAGSGTAQPAVATWYAAGTSPSLIATAGSGNAFFTWSGPVANNASAATTVIMNGPTTVTANFQPVAATLSATIGTATGTIGGIRTWPVILTNTGGTTVTAAQLTWLTISSNGTCKPTATTVFPVSLGNIPVGGSATGSVSVDFSTCSAPKQKTIKFNVTVGYSGNNGASTGTTSLTGVQQ